MANQMLAEMVATREAQDRRHKARYDNASESVVQNKDRFKKFNIKP